MTFQTEHDPDAVSVHYVNAEEWISRRYESMASAGSGELSAPGATVAAILAVADELHEIRGLLAEALDDLLAHAGNRT